MRFPKGTRRTFLGAGAGMAGGKLFAANAKGASGGEDYYEKLGVTKIINAAGTYTALTASIMPPSAQAAVARAAQSPVRLADLQKASGEYIARLLKCEAALVTCGAASALTLGTAACMAPGNRAAVHNLPNDLNGCKTEVIIQKSH